MQRTWLYVLGLDIIAMAVLGNSLAHSLPHQLLWGLVIAAISIWAEMNPLRVNDDGDMTVSGLLHIASLLFIGLPTTLLGVCLAEVAYGIIQRRPAIRTMFNAGQTVITVAVAHWAFIQVGGQDSTLTVHALVLALVYVPVNTLLVASILSLAQRQPLWSTWVGLNKDTLAYSVILSTGGLAFGGLILAYDWFGVFMVVVLIICLRAVLAQASLNLRSMKVQFKNTIKVLMTALEYRDPYTYGHSSRVATWCRKIAEELEHPPTEVDLIELGGLLHDVGKVGVPDSVLNKPATLTREEYEQIKAHPLIGERIILGMEGMEGVHRLAAMARQHHVFYDGDSRGYPSEEDQDAVYRGSRILSVADAWDAMTAERTYRAALSCEEAVTNLLEGRGTQFDPAVVDAFLQILVREQIVPPNVAHPGGRNSDHVRQAG